MPDAFHPLLRASLRASEVDPADPMDIAIHAAASDLLPVDDGDQQHWELDRHFGIRPDLLAMTNMWHDGSSGEERLLAAKGAPEAISRLCRLSASEQREMLQAVEQMAAREAAE